jgi:uncharacterized protein (TIGR02246 family)
MRSFLLYDRLYLALYFGTTLTSERTSYDERIGSACTLKYAMSDIYRFHVEGHLDHTWLAWLGDVIIQRHHDGTTMFTQALPDQSALYGVLFKLSNTGVSLIEVQRMTKETTMTHNRAAEELAIREAIAIVEAGWNAGDGSRFAAPFAEDADYVIVDGRYINGRPTIAQGHQQIFDTIYRNSHNVASVQGIRFLSDDVAVAHVEWGLTLQQDTTAHKSMTTMVMTKANGAWSIAAFQNTPVVSPRT